MSWRTTTVCQRALTARQTPAGVPQPALTVRGTSQERVRMCQGGWPTCYNRLRNVKPAVNMSRRHRAASNPMTTGRNPRTTGLKSKHFSRPPCRGCKTLWPVRATITVAKRRTGTFVRRTKRTVSDFCLNSKIARWSLTVVHAQGRIFPVVVRLLSRWYTDRPTVCNRCTPALKPRECKRGLKYDILSNRCVVLRPMCLGISLL